MRLTLMYAVVVLACAATPALASGPPAPTSPEGVVTAFYYPWFATITEDGDYAHWAQYGHLPPNDISSVYYPALGVYSSDDPSVLDDVAYLAPLGIRTFFVYQAFTLPPASWAEANDALHVQGYVTYADTALVGQAVSGHFTGVYTYDIVTWTGAKFARICAQAHRHHLLCAPSVGPGYDARRAIGDPTVKPRRGGLTYDSMWHAAIRSGADAVTITSFNEWQEGTQIEPAAPPDWRGLYRYASYNGAWGLTGRAAEAAYLDRTAFWISRFLPIQEAQSYPVST